MRQTLCYIIISPQEAFSRKCLSSSDVYCAQLSCNNCQKKFKEHTNEINCNSSVISCDDGEYFCGTVIFHRHETNVSVLRRNCTSHHVCQNTTENCPPSTCFLKCCGTTNCNNATFVNELQIINEMRTLSQQNGDAITPEPTMKNEPTGHSRMNESSLPFIILLCILVYPLIMLTWISWQIGLIVNPLSKESKIANCVCMNDSIILLSCR